MEAILYLDSDKLARAKRAVKFHGGDIADQDLVLKEYKKLEGAYKIEEIKVPKKEKKVKKVKEEIKKTKKTKK